MNFSFLLKGRKKKNRKEQQFHLRTTAWVFWEMELGSSVAPCLAPSLHISRDTLGGSNGKITSFQPAFLSRGYKIQLIRERSLWKWVSDICQVGKSPLYQICIKHDFPFPKIAYLPPPFFTCSKWSEIHNHLPRQTGSKLINLCSSCSTLVIHCSSEGRNAQSWVRLSQS